MVLTEDGVHEQHLSSVHVWRKLGVVDFCFLRLLVALDEDLADADGAAAVPQTLLHGLTFGVGDTKSKTGLRRTVWIDVVSIVMACSVKMNIIKLCWFKSTSMMMPNRANSPDKNEKKNAAHLNTPPSQGEELLV